MNNQKYFGKWEIEEELGSGAFGTVYKISHEEFGRKYYSAMKVIHVPQDKTEKKRLISEGMDENSISSYYYQCVQDFIKEIELMSSLQGHTNIVDYNDHLIEDDPDGMGYTIYIRMEYLTPLDQFLVDDENKFRLLSDKEIMKLGADICNALEVCNKKHIIHRDIKPDNIFISETGDYKLGDFGISRQLEHTQSNLSKKGTYTYMAPEIYNAQPYNSSVDIYSLGIVLYRLLNHNRTPFLPAYPDPIKYTDKEKALVNRMQGVAIPPIPDVDPQINSIILKCCAFDPKDRYQSASELKSDLLKVYKRLPDSESSENSERGITQETIQQNTVNDTDKKQNSHLVDSDNEIEHSKADNSLDETISSFDKDSDESEKSPKSKKGKKSAVIGIVIGAIIVLSVIVVAVMSKSNSAPANKPTETSETTIEETSETETTAAPATTTEPETTSEPATTKATTKQDTTYKAKSTTRKQTTKASSGSNYPDSSDDEYGLEDGEDSSIEYDFGDDYDDVTQAEYDSTEENYETEADNNEDNGYEDAGGDYEEPEDDYTPAGEDEFEDFNDYDE